MAPTKSLVWKHATKIDKITCVCKICNKQIAYNGNTTNVWNHLVQHKIHPGQKNVENDLDNPDDPDSQQDSTPASSSSSPPPPKSPNLGPNLGSTSTLKQAFSRVEAFQPGGSKTNELNDAPAYMVCRDHLPLCVTERPGFLFFAKKMCPLWKPPSRKTVTKIIDEKHAQLQKATRQTLSEASHIVLTTDGWTNTMTSVGFLGVTAHYLRKDELKIESVMIGVERLDEASTADYLKSKLEHVCEDWAINKANVVMGVTDNAPNIVKAVKDIFGPNKHFGCFAHSLNLLATDCFAVKTDTDGKQKANVPGLNFLISMVRDVVTSSKSSSTLANEIRKLQYANGKSEGTALRLKQDSPTRWNSTYQMITRFLEMYDIVGLAVLKVARSPPMPNAAQLESLRTIAKIFAPLQQATLDISAEQSPTLSKVIPLLSLITKGISMVIVDRSDPVSQMLKDFLLANIVRRFGMYEYKRTLAVATILDPRFKNIHFQHDDAGANATTFLGNAVWDLIQEKHGDIESEATAVEAATGTVSEGDIWAIHDEIAAKTSSRRDQQVRQREGLPDELRRYLAQPVSSRRVCPLTEWHAIRLDFPNLHSLAMQYVPILASSVPSERLFSKAGIIMSDLRNRLTGEHLSQQLFLSSLTADQWEQKKKK